MQKFMAIGRIGKTPEIKRFENGAVANTTLAIDESYKNKSGERVEKTEWVNLVFNNARAEFAAKYLSKGQKIHIEGKIKTRKYETQQNETRYITEVQVLNVTFCESKQTNGGTYESEKTNEYKPPVHDAKPIQPHTTDADDDLPF